jgi:Transglycosylase-like domain
MGPVLVTAARVAARMRCARLFARRRHQSVGSFSLPARTAGRGRCVLVLPDHAESRDADVSLDRECRTARSARTASPSVRKRLPTFACDADGRRADRRPHRVGRRCGKRLRASIDAIATKYFAAQETARVIDSELRALDRRIAVTRRRVALLHPLAKATAVQLYTGSTQGFTALFDVASAMESARRAELIARVGDHTQAVLNRYTSAADTLALRRTELARVRAKQAKVVADLGRQEGVLERALAKAQQAYRDELAAQARARAIASQTTTTSGSSTSIPTLTTIPPAPPAPIRVQPPAPPDGGANPHHDDPFLVCTRTRESSGNYAAVNPAGYYGAYQFSRPTWDVTASHAGRPELIGVEPDQASAWYQDELAWVLYQWQGKGPWLGLC